MPDFPDNPRHSIGAVSTLVRQRRRELGLNQEDLADLAGCSPRFIRELEAGKSTVRLDKLVAALTALGLDLTVGRRHPG